MELRILTLLAVHYLADWPLQNLLPGDVAIHKSHDWKALLLHTVTYSLCFLAWGWKFAAITFVAHTLTDAVTSRLTARWWFVEYEDVTTYLEVDGIMRQFEMPTIKFDVRKRTWFFNTIGFDQLLHAAQLILTLRLLA